MNILQLEQERTLLKENLAGGFSIKAKHIFLQRFFEKILSTENKNIIDSYIPEFLPEYIHRLNSWTVFGVKPRMHELLTKQAEQIEKTNLLKENGFDSIAAQIEKLKKESEKLNSILNGEAAESYHSAKAYFPLLEEDAIKEIGMTIGVLESVTIKINHTKNADKFIIIPSEKEIEEKINKQVKLSWQNAVRVAKKYVRKIHPYHEVIISFDKRAGFCKGNSLGTALTLAFIEEIFKTYNSPLSIKVGEGIAFTGGMDERGKITNTSEEIIKQKIELVFYSAINHFVVPKEEETAAIEKLNELKEEFPQRDLRIIGIEDIDDLLNRRNIVEIKKQPVIVRTGKFIKKNWVSAAVAALLTIILSFLFVLDFDDNPHSFRVDGAFLYVLNKNGKVLWEKKVVTSKSQIEDPIKLKGQIKIVDIDSDGRNELLITIEQLVSKKADSEYNQISCYDSKGKVIWRYSFKDKVSSERTELPPVYATNIIDTLTIKGTKNLFLFANNSPSFSSAIFRLDLQTGERLPSTLWCSGHTVNGIVKDINNDGNNDILCVGLDNGFEDAVLFGLEIDSLTKVRPTTDEYLIRGFLIGELITYIRFPKTDYDEYKKFRTPAPYNNSFLDELSQKYYQFFTMDYLNDYNTCLWYQIDYNLKDVNVIIDNRFRVMRDTLVAHGKLPLPYTDTPEYVELIKSKILYYKDGKWVKREELE